MPRIALWDVSNAVPTRLAESGVDLEAHLEEWIERDPSMLQGGLEIVARQMVIEAGRLDLLALDPQARLCVVEIKRGALTREAVAQAVDYAACLEAMEAEMLKAQIDAYLAPRGKSVAALLDARQAPDALDLGERDVVMFVVGVGRQPGLERIAGFFGRREVPLSLVSFDAFVTADGHRILSREVEEAETVAPSVTPRATPTGGDILQLAEANGVGAVFRTLYQAGVGAGLYPRIFKASVMFTPPAMRTRALFTIWVKPRDGQVQAWVGNTVFTEYFPLSLEAVQAALGAEGWRQFDHAAAVSFADRLRSLLGSANQT
jgi:Holliday junction resolvase-like predicted endonuclease